MRQGTSYTVLVVEDDPNHGLLISLAFKDGAPDADVHLTRRAEEAITYVLGLVNTPASAEAKLPDVIVLDIGMPGIGGIGFLEWLAHQDRRLQDIPVVVFTSSDDPDLARRCYSLGAREFKMKSADFGELVELVGLVLRRWRPGSQGAVGASA